jgi:hypothetical protein
LTNRRDRLAEALGPEQLGQLIHVADSALVTGPNLARCLRFIFLCPETFSLERRGCAITAASHVPTVRMRGSLDEILEYVQKEWH